jgi:D-beta-D-heptose 7-phosphate kinase/D-beta-D-heptose 1-phosphate adenosyltransferase
VTEDKILTLPILLDQLLADRQAGRRIVFTNGCFDILHAGHVAYLREARKQGDLLVVGLNSDDSIRSIKGPDRPVNHQDDRLLVLSELQSVDYLVVFGEDTPIKLIEAIRPDVLAKGADYAREQVVGHKIVEAHGGEVALIDLVEGRSTTNIIRKLQDHSVAD